MGFAVSLADTEQERAPLLDSQPLPPDPVLFPNSAHDPQPKVKKSTAAMRMRLSGSMGVPGGVSEVMVCWEGGLRFCLPLTHPLGLFTTTVAANPDVQRGTIAAQSL